MECRSLIRRVNYCVCRAFQRLKCLQKKSAIYWIWSLFFLANWLSVVLSLEKSYLGVGFLLWLVF